MEFQTLVMNRHSIRRFKPDAVSDDTLRQLLAWGHMAPSGGNRCPWEFIVIRSQEQKRRVVDTTFCGNSEQEASHQDWIATAPVVVAVCADEDRIRARYGGTSIWQSLAYLDCSACIENILLGAVELGLGSCYVSGFHEKPMREALGLPEHVRPIALLPIGYPQMEGHARPRPALETLIHQETY